MYFPIMTPATGATYSPQKHNFAKMGWIPSWSHTALEAIKILVSVRKELRLTVTSMGYGWGEIWSFERMGMWGVLMLLAPNTPTNALRRQESIIVFGALPSLCG